MQSPHRLRLWMVPLLLLGLALGSAQLAACGGGGGAPPPDTEEPPVDPPTEPPVDPPTEWPPLDPLAATRLVTTDHFATAPACAVCHENADTANAMRDDADRAIAPMDLWRASAMANSTRDPYWRAVVSAEVATNPTHAAEIQDTCTRCHAPMAHERVGAAGGALDMSFLEADDDNAQLGLDGVSCAACHQIADEGLGSDDSYTGGFVIGSNRLIYGGHANPNPIPMQNSSGFTPVYSTHMGSSALCGTCHTLETESLDADGTVNGHVLVEQGTYLEWRNSAFNDEGEAPGPQAASCVDCHMPSTDQDGGAIATQLAHNPSGGDFGPGAAPVRNDYHRHTLVGANTLLPRLLRENADVLRPNASAAALQANEDAARAMLATQSAGLTLASQGRSDATLALMLRVSNTAGHKLPTAYPSRRAWVRLRVYDGTDTLVFASGEHDSRGRLLDTSGNVLPSELVGGGFEPHRTQITSGDQVQIYESVMQDAAGQATWRLLRAATYAKDNRLLPRGWDPHHADAARAGVWGGATGDEDFVGGQDDVTYLVEAPAAAGPYRVEATLLYQVLKPRFAVELFEVDTGEVASFKALYEATDVAPEVMARAQVTVP